MSYPFDSEEMKMDLTAGQRDALNRLCRLAPSGVVDLRPEIEIVQSLLSNSVPTWEATEERKAAIKDAMEFLAYAEIRNRGINPGNEMKATNAHEVLRAMLEEEVKYGRRRSGDE